MKKKNEEINQSSNFGLALTEGRFLLQPHALVKLAHFERVAEVKPVQPPDN